MRSQFLCGTLASAALYVCDHVFTHGDVTSVWNSVENMHFGTGSREIWDAEHTIGKISCCLLGLTEESRLMWG